MENLNNSFSGILAVEPFCTFKAPFLDEPPYRITCLNYFENGKELLVSYSSDHLYLFDLKVSNILEFHVYLLDHLKWFVKINISLLL